MQYEPQYQSPYQQPYQVQALEYVGIGRRFFAILIDGIIIGFVAGAISTLFRSGYEISGVAYMILTFLYFTIMEAMAGATVGKMALGIHVATLSGSHIGWGESVIRNVLRIIDALVFYLIAAIFVSSSPIRQRLCDRAAHTVVV